MVGWKPKAQGSMHAAPEPDHDWRNEDWETVDRPPHKDKNGMEVDDTISPTLPYHHDDGARDETPYPAQASGAHGPRDDEVVPAASQVDLAGS